MSVSIPPPASSAVDADDAFVALELARRIGGSDPALRRAVELLALVLLDARRTGSTRIPLPRLFAAALAVGAGEAEARALEPLARGLRHGDAGLGGAAAVFTVDDRSVAIARLACEEERLARAVRARLTGGLAPPSALAEVLADLARRPVVAAAGRPIELDEAASAAIRAALDRPLTVITGGPGTGKTSLVVHVLRALGRLVELGPEDVVLAAPTGLAADRLLVAVRGQLERVDAPGPADLRLASGLTAGTLHRTLGYSPTLDRFRRRAEHPLDAKVVVVDEASMLDLELATRVFDATPPGARLVLVGDAEQLPPIEPGAVLRELVSAPQVSAVRLAVPRRVDAADPDGRSLLALAADIRAGEFDPSGLRSVRRAADLSFSGVELLELGEARGLDEFVRAWERGPGGRADEELTRQALPVVGGRLVGEAAERCRAALTRLASARVLCPLRGEGGALGTELLARLLHERPRLGPGVGPGEPLLVGRNDYRRGLYNGEQGLAILGRADGLDPEGFACFARGDELVAFPLAGLSGVLEPGFATTVHKAQGSEYDHVAVVWPRADGPFLTRELLYTAVTRARRSVTLVGDRATLAAAAARVTERHQGLAARIASEGG